MVTNQLEADFTFLHGYRSFAWLARLRLASRAQREIFRTHLIGQLTVTRHR